MKSEKFKNSLWPFFLLFAAVNALLAYGSAPLELKILTGGLGLLIPLLWITLKRPIPPGRKIPESRKFLSGLNLGAGIFLVLGAVFLRFYKLDSFSTWPSTDEGWGAAYPLELLRHWDWRLLFGPEKFPPFYSWALALCFKIFQPSLWSLWFLPAFISLLNIFLAYAAARMFFPQSFSLLCAGLMAFSFWPLLDGRIASVGTLIPVWELLSLWLLGRLIKNPPSGHEKLLGAALGLALVCGFYSWGLGWISFWLFFHGCAAWKIFSQKRKPGIWGIVLAAEAAALIPLAAAYFQAGAGDYVYRLSVFNSQSAWWPGVYNPWSYLTCLLWGADASGFVYRPQWGGFLNPVMGSFFILGLAAALGRWKQFQWKCLLLAFPFFLLPDLFSQTFEMYRMILLMPWLILMTALGVEVLMRNRKAPLWIFLGLFLISGGLDLYHLFGVYRQNWAKPGIQWAHFKSLERWRAFDALQAQRRASGPGLILSDLIERNYDRTLDVGTYTFDAAHNPSLSGVEPSWGAILFPAHLKPFLQKRFPDGQWVDLSEGLTPSEQSKCLGFIPLNPARRQSFLIWQKANDAFKGIAYQMMDSPRQMTYAGLGQALAAAQSNLSEDPLLEACFDQKMLGMFDNERHPKDALYWLDRDIRFGYASPFFLQKRAALLKTKREAS